MNRIAPRTLALLAVPVVTLLGVQTTSCDSSNTSENGGGGGGGGGGNAQPVVTALPAGGDYAENRTVVLNANEAATIYYYLTTDKNDPTMPDPADPGSVTGSGAAPLTGITLAAAPSSEVEYRLSFMAVDSGGVASVPATETYLIDRKVPTIGVSAPPPAIGVLGSASVMWSATDDGTYFATLGGDGSPTSGIEVASGIYPMPPEGQSFPTLEITVSGFDLELGGSDVPLTLFFSDAAGNEATAEWLIDQRPLHRAPVPTGTSELAAAPGLERVHAIDAAAQQVLVIDPAKGTTEAMIDVDSQPSRLALTPDESALYVGCLASIQKIDTMTNAVVATIPVAAGEPSGLAATPDGARVYFTVSDGTLAYVDTTNDAIQSTGVASESWTSSHIAFTADPANTRAAIAWKNASIYSVEVYDLMADGLTGTDPLTTVAGGASLPGRVVTANAMANRTAWAGGLFNDLSRFTLEDPPDVEESAQTLEAGGLALTPTDSHLVLSQADSLLLGFRDPAALSTTLGVYDVALAADAGLSSTGVGASMQVVDWPGNVRRLYFVKNPGTSSAELIGLALE